MAFDVYPIQALRENTVETVLSLSVPIGVECSTLTGVRLLRLLRVYSLCLSP